MNYEVFYDAKKMPMCDVVGILVAETKLCGIVNNCPLRRRPVPYDAIDFYKNNNRRFRVAIRDPELNYVDLTGGYVLFTVKLNKSDVTPVIQLDTRVPSQGQLGAADEGECFFYLVPANTSSLTICQYVYDITAFLADGQRYTVNEGVLNLLQPVI